MKDACTHLARLWSIQFSGDLHEDEELVYREEWDASHSEAASVEDHSRFPTAYGRDRVDSAAAEPPNAAGVVWTSIGMLLTLFSDVWVAGKRWLHPADRSDKIVSKSCKFFMCDYMKINVTRYGIRISYWTALVTHLYSLKMTFN